MFSPTEVCESPLSRAADHNLRRSRVTSGRFHQHAEADLVETQSAPLRRDLAA